ncbi:MAG TPA: phosphoglycolate phosphatase [Rudaea sp.]|nr:phosphoglycolate phosphatase [Rudaea sp.]
MSEARIRAVLFDMDGTLVDTLPDISASVNAALVDLGLQALDRAHIATLIGNGPRVLSRRALDAQETLGAADRERLVEPLLESYARNYATQAGRLGRIFPGTLEGLRELSAAGFKLGVVTNALQHLAEAVLARFGIAPHLDLVVGGDRVTRTKPHPDPLWQACRELDVAPHETLMVGDSINDVVAARAAGCAIVCVPHGYDQGQPVDELGCDVLAALTALPAWIAAYERQAAAALAAAN